MRTKRPEQAGFTLLEMMLAVAILVIITITVHQFTQVSLRAADASLQAGEQAMQLGGFRRLLDAQLSALPSGQSGSLIGMNIKKAGARQDAMQMVCPAGNALLTPDAKGFYQVTLDLRETPRGSGRYALGLEREPWTDDDEDDDDEEAVAPAVHSQVKNGGKPAAPSDWVQLIDNVQSLEIAYFDARLNGWVDKWTDSALLPNLVRVRLTVGGSEVPYEIVEKVPGGGVGKTALPTTVQNLLGQGLKTH